MLGAEILLLAALAVALVIRRRQWHRYSFWLATMVYSLLTILSITIGRSGLGVHQALSSRYSTFAISLVAATYVILISLAREHPASRLWRFQGVLIGLLLLVVGLGDVAGYLSGSRGREVRQYLAFVVSTIEDQPDEVYNPGYLDSLRSKAAFLKRQGDNVFAKGGIAEKYAPLSDTLPRLSDPTQFKIDGFQEIDDHKAYSVTGWAVDSVHGDLAGGVYLVLDGKEYPLYYGAPRPEVATRLQNEGLLHCGFQRLLPAKVVAPGRHEVSLKVLTNDRQALLNTGGGMAMDIK